MPLTTFCGVPKIEDASLRRALNPYGYGLLLEIDDESPPPTFELCKTLARLFPSMIQQLDPWLARRDRVKKIHWGLLEHRGIAAVSSFAYVPEPYEFIGLSHGLIASAMDIFNRILAHPENLLTVGDPSKEVPPPTIKLTDHPLQTIGWQWVTPKCPIRRHVAEALAITSLQMVMLHEYSHLANGHVAYLHELGNPKDPLLTQTLEMDADASSMFLMVQMCRQKWAAFHADKSPASDLKSANEVLFSTPMRCFMTILLSGYTFFRMFNKPWNRATQTTATHPQYAYRMKGLADGLAENLRNQPIRGYTPDQFILDSGNVFGSTDHAFAYMTGDEPSREIFDSVFTQSGADEYFFDLEIKWADIIPELEKHVKIARLSPVDWSRIPKRS